MVLIDVKHKNSNIQFYFILVRNVNAPKVTITLGSDDDFKKTGSRRGSIARQEARDIDDTEEHITGDTQFHNSNNTSETILE